jgi:hypothetical protein
MKRAIINNSLEVKSSWIYDSIAVAERIRIHFNGE